MNIKDHALQEFKAAGWLDEPIDEMQQLMMDNLLEIVEVFAAQDHSGFSASYAIDVLEKLLRFKPLVPLTGEDWEWVDVSEYSGVTTFQNKRCSAVFKQADRFDGKPYYLDGKVFVDKEGCSFTNSDSMVPVEFPYTPKTEYVYL